MLKPNDKEARLQQALRLNLPEDEYESIWKLVRSRVDSSLFLGLSPSEDSKIDNSVRLYIEKCLKDSKDVPQFFDADGKSFPLASYYRKNPDLFSIDDAFRLSNFPEKDVVHISTLYKKVHDYEKTLELSDSTCFDDYLYLFD